MLAQAQAVFLDPFIMLWSLLTSYLLLAAAPVALSATVEVTDIQGIAFETPLLGQSVNVTALVTAKGSSGFWLRGTPSSDIRASYGLNVFTSSKTILASVTPGDLISLTGTVSEFRSSTAPDDLFLTELTSPKNITVLSSGNAIPPVVLGVDRSPPTLQLSAFDTGPDGYLSVPNNKTQIDSPAGNVTLQPDLFGLDFWESLEGQLVTVRTPVVTDFENSFGEFWVRGNWPTTGINARGGISITFGPDGKPDANPELLIVGSPLDGTKNPHVAVGQQFADITGVIHYQFSFYYILPTTAPTLVSSPDFNVPPATIKPKDDACTLTFGDYNVENLDPRSSHLSNISNHIANFLNSPDIVFLQEIQDNSGVTDDGTVSANVTLTNVVNSIFAASGNKTKYNFLEVEPVNDQDGGQPGGNIRVAYLYNPAKVRLAGTTITGGPLNATEVVKESDGKIGLTFNPGRINPTSSAWTASRKPLVAVWESALSSSTGDRFFTINLHLTSKDGGSSSQGSSRPPVNGGVDQRTAEVEQVAIFVESLLELSPYASVLVAGDCNEFLQTRSVYSAFTSPSNPAFALTDLDELAGIPPVERYTYVFDQQNEQLDHAFVSKAVKARGGIKLEHVHVNNWSQLLSLRSSDHDPTVGQIKVC